MTSVLHSEVFLPKLPEWGCGPSRPWLRFKCHVSSVASLRAHYMSLYVPKLAIIRWVCDLVVGGNTVGGGGTDHIPEDTAMVVELGRSQPVYGCRSNAHVAVKTFGWHRDGVYLEWRVQVDAKSSLLGLMV